MTITELINKLQALKENHGDINVEVQYRDGGGCYHGTDENIEPVFVENKWGKAIIL